MNTRTFKNDPAKLLEKGTEIINTTKNAKYIIRVAMVNMVLAETASTDELSRLSGIPKRTINSWVKKVDDIGFDALKAIKQSGRPSRLTETQLAEIKVAVESDPEESGYRLWDGTTLSDFINSKYDVELGVRQCQRLFHALGFSKIQPQKYPSLNERNDEEREEYKKN